MAEISFTCPNCGVELEAEESVAGSVLQCPGCSSCVMVPMPGIKPGMKISGYEIIRRLGIGGMGEVWLANQTAMDRKVALKILSPALTSNPEFVDRFLKEVRTAAKLQHQNIVTAFDAGQDGNIYYLAMSYVDGLLLDDKLGVEKIIPEKEALRMLRSIAEALRYAWDEFQMIHRDIKPANIILDSKNVPRLMDMGISKSVSEEKGLTMTGVVIGTPYYMSPEQARADFDVDCRSDIYALGATLYHIVTGEVPYDATTAMGILTKHITDPFPPPQRKNPAVSEACAVLLEVMMAKSSENRPKNWSAAIEDIDLVLADKFPKTKRPSTGESLVMQMTNSQALSRRKIMKPPPKAKMTRNGGKIDLAANSKDIAPQASAPGAKSRTPIIAAAALAVLIIAGIIGAVLIGNARKAAVEKAGIEEQAKIKAENERRAAEDSAKKLEADKKRAEEEEAKSEKERQELWDAAAKFAEQAFSDKTNLDAAVASLEKVKSNCKGTKFEIMADAEIAKLAKLKSDLEAEKLRKADEDKKAIADAAAKISAEKEALQVAEKQKSELLSACADAVIRGEFKTALDKYDSSRVKDSFPELGKSLRCLASENESILNSFQTEFGKFIEVETANGEKIKVKPIEIKDGKLVCEIRMGPALMKKSYAPESFSSAERLKRIALTDKTSAAMKSISVAAKAKKCNEVAKLAEDCGVLSSLIMTIVERRQKDKLCEDASAEFSTILTSCGLKKAELPDEGLPPEIEKLKSSKKTDAILRQIKDFQIKYAGTDTASENEEFLASLQEALGAEATEILAKSSAAEGKSELKLDKKLAKRINEARTKTGKVIKVSPEGKEEGTVTPEKAAEIAKPGNIVRFVGEWKGVGAQQNWDYKHHPPFKSEGLIIECDAPLRICAPKNSIVRNSEIDILSTGEGSIVVDSTVNLYRPNKTQTYNSVLSVVQYNGGDIVSCTLHKTNPVRSHASFCPTILRNCIVYSEEYALGFEPSFKGKCMADNCIIFGKKAIGVITDETSQNKGKEFHDLKSLKDFVKANNCIEQKPNFEKTDPSIFKSVLRLTPDSPGYGRGIGANLNEAGFPVPIK